MSKYCDYNKDNFYECLVKDDDLRNDFLDMLSPMYQTELNKKNDRDKLIDGIKYMLNKGINQFSIDSYVPYRDALKIAEDNRLDCSYDMERGLYWFRIKI